MTIGPLSAAKFYNVAKTATQAKPQNDGAASTFGKVAADFAQIVQQGENTAMSAMAGKADMPSLVEALSKSELAVQTAVTVRDKVVSAYQEILRMPV